jgi:thiamine pyrophosphokinase
MAKNNPLSILIIANGLPPESETLQKLAGEASGIIAINGGSVICFHHNIQPDYIIGDLDSLRPELHDYFEKAKFVHRPDQDYNDLEKAIEFARKLKPGKIKIVSAFGKRADHTLANLLVLQSKYKKMPLVFYDGFGTLEIICRETILDLPVNRLISLFSFLPVHGITLEGFKYSLLNADYPKGFNGLSNLITNPPARITVRKGSLFLYTLLEHD